MSVARRGGWSIEDKLSRAASCPGHRPTFIDDRALLGGSTRIPEVGPSSDLACDTRSQVVKSAITRPLQSKGNIGRKCIARIKGVLRESHGPTYRAKLVDRVVKAEVAR